MQDRKRIKNTAKRRKAARLNKAALYSYAESAAKIGTAAKSIYLQTRLGIDRYHAARLFRCCRFYGMTASKILRAAIRYDAAGESFEDRKKILRAYWKRAEAIKRANQATPSLKPRRPYYVRQKKPSRYEIWAKQSGSNSELRRIVLNLTAADLADLAIKADEFRIDYQELKKAGGLEDGAKQPKASISHAGRRALGYFLCMIHAAAESAEKWAGGLEADKWEYRRPTRAKRWRTITELKKRIKEAGTKAGL